MVNTFITVMCLLGAEVVAVCRLPASQESQLEVEQESPDRVTLHWGHVWWDLDLQCLDSLQVILNGESVGNILCILGLYYNGTIQYVFN